MRSDTEALCQPPPPLVRSDTEALCQPPNPPLVRSDTEALCQPPPPTREIRYRGLVPTPPPPPHSSDQIPRPCANPPPPLVRSDTEALCQPPPPPTREIRYRGLVPPPPPPLVRSDTEALCQQPPPPTRPKHAGAGVGGAPRGRSSTCERRDNCPPLSRSKKGFPRGCLVAQRAAHSSQSFCALPLPNPTGGQPNRPHVCRLPSSKGRPRAYPRKYPPVSSLSLDGIAPAAWRHACIPHNQVRPTGSTIWHAHATFDAPRPSPTTPSNS